jgi:hypothetical protein
MTEDAQKPYSFSSYNERDGRSYNSASGIPSIIVDGKFVNHFRPGRVRFMQSDGRKYAKRLVLAYYSVLR